MSKWNDLPCPKCKKSIAFDAQVCPYCRSELTEDEIRARRRQVSIGLSIGALLLVGTLGYCTWSSSPDPKEAAAAAAKAADENRKGLHCLSPWDGSSSQFVEAVKRQLRDPNSFEHAETRIAPVDGKGQHLIVMGYRAKNGFGGMNAVTAMGTVSNKDCSAIVTVLDADNP